MAYGQFMEFRWQVPPDIAFTRLVEEYNRRIIESVARVLQKWIPIVVDWMQANAPWKDRTTAARAGLHGEVERLLNEAVLLHFRYSVEYGAYLEGWNPKTNNPMANAGRFAIIEPAMDEFSDRIWADVNGIFV